MANINNKKTTFSINLATDFFETLPYPLSLLVKGDAIERDVLFISMTTGLSASMPSYLGRWKKSGYKISPHLYTFICGGTGTGKGEAVNGMEPFRALSRYVRDLSKKERDDFMRDCEEEEIKNAPPLKSLLISDDTTASALMKRISNNEDRGCLLFSSEAGLTICSMKSDFGQKMSPVFCKAFHHEPVSKDLSSEEFSISADVECPRLAMCLTGTPKSLEYLFREESDSGLLQRMLICCLPKKELDIDGSPPEYECPSITIKDYVFQIYKDLSGRERPLLFDMSRSLLNSFNKKMNEVYSRLTKVSELYDSCLLRMSISLYRITMILSAFKNKEALKTADRIVADESYMPFLDHLADFFSQHLLLAGTSFGVGKRQKSVRITPEMVLGLVKSNFTYSDLRDIFVQKAGVTQKAAQKRTERALAKLLLWHKIEKTDSGYKKAENDT